MNFKDERKLIKQLFEEGKLDSLGVQVIALNLFAKSIGFNAVNGDVRKGFVASDAFVDFNFTNMSLEEMQHCYNHGYRNIKTSNCTVFGNRVVEKISLQHNKRTNKKLTTQLKCIKFVKEV